MNSRYITDSVIVYRTTSSTGGIGGERVKTWTTHLSLDGSFQNMSADKSIVDNVEAFRKTKIFYCDCVDITDKDQILYDGKYYEITAVNNYWNHHLEIAMKIRSTS